MRCVPIRFFLTAGGLAMLALAGGCSAAGIKTPAGKTAPVAVRNVPCGVGMIQVPDGVHAWPNGGAPSYSVPGPIIRFKGADGVWRGKGYMDTLYRILRMQASTEPDPKDPSSSLVRVRYDLEGGRQYLVSMLVSHTKGTVLIDGVSTAGPESWFVMDFNENFPADTLGLTRRDGVSVYRHLGCLMDRLQARITSQPDPQQPAAGLSVFSAKPGVRDLASFWVRKPGQWSNPAAMALELWEHRQLPNDPESRVSLGRTFKADGTPNPRVENFVGKSVYQGHVCLTAALGSGLRFWGMLLGVKSQDPKHISDALAEQIAKVSK